MKTKLILGVLSAAIILTGITAVLPAQTRPQLANAAQTSDKCYDNCTDPDRPYFDMWGNQFAYDGTLLHVATCPYTDPISHQPNPYCPAVVTTPAPSQTTAPPATVNPNQCGAK